MTGKQIKKTPRINVLIRYVELAEGLASESSTGKVPSVTWLRRNDYAGLYLYMRAHPRPFKHLKQEDLGHRTYDLRIKQRQVSLAEKLATRNKGELYSPKWLRDNGYKELVSYMRRHPEFFEDIPQVRDLSASEKHVQTAERLAYENGGVFPPPWSVIKEYGYALRKHMDRYPELFDHIPRS